jgi:2,3-bisphosphoglycerate-dependent phosphoglycerate mutase
MPDANEPKTHLYLIRHAQGIVNVNPTIVGKSSDVGLTPLGVQQAERLRDRLAATGEIAADVLLASTYRRASQTAEIIAPALGLDIQYDDELQEHRLGDDVDGMSIAEFDAKYPQPDYLQEPFRAITPASENWPQFMLRVGATIDRIARQHRGKTVALVTHGGFVDGSFIYFFGLPSMRLPSPGFYTENTSITHWGEDERWGQRIWRLFRYNDDVHLRGLDRGKSINWRELALPPTGERFAPPSPPSPPMLGRLGQGPAAQESDELWVLNGH